MEALVDADVQLDIITGRKPFCDRSRAAVLACINGGVEILVAATSLKDIFYLMVKHLDASRDGANGLTS